MKVRFADTKTVVRFVAAALSQAQFNALVEAYFASLPEYDSNEDAILGGLTAGMRYVAGSGHNAAPHGAILTVV